MQHLRPHGSPRRWLVSGQTMLDGPDRDALLQAVATLDRAEGPCRPHEMVAALVQVGRCYRGMQALVAAEDAFRQALRWARSAGSADAQVDVLCELAETACALGDEWSAEDPAAARAARERARDVAFEVARMARQVADAHWEFTVLLRISDVLNRCGDHDDAAGLQSRAVRLMPGGEAPGT